MSAGRFEKSIGCNYPALALTHWVETDFGRVSAVPIARLRINCASIPIDRDTENRTV